MKHWPVAAAIAVLTLLSFYVFPGHTWLQQDTQIYVPILEHLRDPSVLANDILVERPHVTFTLYDEIALALRRITGLGFRELLGAEQVATRANDAKFLRNLRNRQRAFVVEHAVVVDRNAG